jgi:hypothetical protein
VNARQRRKVADQLVDKLLAQNEAEIRRQEGEWIRSSQQTKEWPRLIESNRLFVTLGWVLKELTYTAMKRQKAEWVIDRSNGSFGCVMTGLTAEDLGACEEFCRRMRPIREVGQ